MSQVSYNYSDEELFGPGLLERTENSSAIVRTILTTVGSVIGLLPSEKPMLSDNFFDIGGNSINAVLVLAKLDDLGYKVNVEQFIAADTILDVARIVLSKDQDQGYSQPRDSFFKLRPLRLEDKDKASKSTAKKSHLKIYHKGVLKKSQQKFY